MFEHIHPHLLDVAGAKRSRRRHAFDLRPSSKVPRLYGDALDEDPGPKPLDIRRFRCHTGSGIAESPQDHALDYCEEAPVCDTTLLMNPRFHQ